MTRVEDAPSDGTLLPDPWILQPRPREKESEVWGGYTLKFAMGDLQTYDVEQTNLDSTIVKKQAKKKSIYSKKQEKRESIQSQRAREHRAKLKELALKRSEQTLALKIKIEQKHEGVISRKADIVADEEVGTFSKFGREPSGLELFHAIGEIPRSSRAPQEPMLGPSPFRNFKNKLAAEAGGPEVDAPIKPPPNQAKARTAIMQQHRPVPFSFPDGGDPAQCPLMLNPNRVQGRATGQAAIVFTQPKAPRPRSRVRSRSGSHQSARQLSLPLRPGEAWSR
jgi:hypothetical protein